MTGQPRSLDEARRLFPALGFALYAYTPGLPVTLEVHDGDALFSWTADTEAAAFAQAFPDEQPLAAVSDPSSDSPFGPPDELPEIEADEPAPPSVFD